MPKFAANISMLFTERDFMDRFAAAASAGFRAVEYQFPYDFEPDAIAAELKRHDLAIALHNLPPGDWKAGERGNAILPDRVDEFKEGVETALRYAGMAGCPKINCLAGLAPAGAEPGRLRDTFVANLQYAAAKLKDEGIRLMIEPVNTRDVPGFFLNTTRQALEVIELVGSDNLFIQYDIYHMQIMQGDLARTLEGELARIGHIQLADNPGRHEPGSGEINFPFLFGHLDRIGYDGWIGCEYVPAGRTEDGLGWLAGAIG